ncbi:MAG: hypothetical protein K2J77_00170 [Oscillospiraceae bacterium]|nr:hypothetical protein [Oscillospiraceae bacterium]
MKTRKLLAASTAALLAAASVGVVAFAETPEEEEESGEVAGAAEIKYDKNGISIGDGVKAFIDGTSSNKAFKNYKLEASEDDVTAEDSDADAVVDVENCNVIKDLNDDLKDEFAEIKASDVKIYNITLSKGIYLEEKAPEAITLKVEIPFDAKVYHVSGDKVELLKSSSQKLTSGGYEVTFTSKSFSAFIFTTAKLENASAASATTSSTTSSGTSGTQTPAAPNTGIALAIAPVLLAATAVSVVALKKKHD